MIEIPQLDQKYNQAQLLAEILRNRSERSLLVDRRKTDWEKFSEWLFGRKSPIKISKPPATVKIVFYERHYNYLKKIYDSGYTRSTITIRPQTFFVQIRNIIKLIKSQRKAQQARQLAIKAFLK